MVITGLAQKYLEKCLECNVAGSAKGIVLEVKEEKGLGTTVDVIVHDGKLKVNDTIVIGTLDEPIVTKVRALFEPKPLAEMMDKSSKFISVKEVHAATGVKIAGPGIENAVAGMPVMVATKENLEQIKESIRKEVQEVLIKTDKSGIIIKADSLGSLEALTKMLKEKEIKIRRASIGDISKKDFNEAECNVESDPLNCAILGFNVKVGADIQGCCKIINHNVIYKLIEDLEKWQEEEKKRIEQTKLAGLVSPCKFQIMKGYIFRQNNPAVVGADILEGVLKVGTPIMKDGKHISNAKSIQVDQKGVEKIQKGKQGAVSIPGVTVGRQINEGDILYSGVPDEDFKKLKDLKHLLSKEVWGV